MDVKMAQTCMTHGIAVMCGTKRYYRINAIMSRKYIAGEAMDNRPARILVALYDGVGNSITWVPVEDVHLLDIPKTPTGGDADEADGNVGAPASGNQAENPVARADILPSDMV